MMRTLMMLSLIGCADMEMKGAMSADEDFGGAELDASREQLRIDVIPSSESADLAAQSWIIPEGDDLTALNVRVSPSIEVTGTVVGYEATPFGAEVPGADNMPMDAQVTLYRPGTINGNTVATELDGSFSLSVPPSGGYQLSIVPRDAPTVPFSVDSQLRLVEDTDYEVIDLGYGEPVYGKVTYSDGDPVEGAMVRATDPETGIAGPSTLTDANGHYMLRVPEGLLDIVAGGNPGTYLPAVTQEIEVLEETGTLLDFDMGDVTPVQVSGTVVGDASGQRQKDIKVRFRSSALADVEGELEVLTETDGDGLFARSILPGDWLVEFIPPFDSDQSPTQFGFSISDEPAPRDLSQIELPDRVMFSRKIVDPNGNALPGAVINAKETGFDGYIHSATADINGRVEVELPAVDLDMTIVPPTTELAVTKLRLNPADHTGRITVSAGQPVSGVVRSEGEPVGFALVEVRREDGTLLASTITGPDGTFAVQIEGTD